MNTSVFLGYYNDLRFGILEGKGDPDNYGTVVMSVGGYSGAYRLLTFSHNLNNYGSVWLANLFTHSVEMLHALAACDEYLNSIGLNKPLSAKVKAALKPILEFEITATFVRTDDAQNFYCVYSIRQGKFAYRYARKQVTRRMLIFHETTWEEVRGSVEVCNFHKFKEEFDELDKKGLVAGLYLEYVPPKGGTCPVRSWSRG